MVDVPALWRRVWFRTTLVGSQEPDVTRGPDAPPDAWRPLGPLQFGDTSLPATLCHPPLTVTWTVPSLAPGRLALPIALLPEARKGHPAGLTFALTAQREPTGRRAHTRTTLHPSDAASWRWIRIQVPDGEGPVTIRLSTAIAPGGSSAWAWAACGPIHLERPRPLDELTRAVRTTLETGRTLGWRRALRQAWQGAQPITAGVNYAHWEAQHRTPDSTLAEQRAAAATWPTPPRVSVITPAYNTQPDWLRDCHASLMAQTYPHWQWCVADDASTDVGTQSALATVATDPRVSLVRLPVNGGISVASNAALARASGEIVVLLDHDDTLPPDALFEVAAAFHADPALELLYSDEDKLESDGTLSDPYFKPDWSPELLMATNYACHLTAARRTLVERVGGFRPGYEGAQDYDLWLRMMEVTPRVRHIAKVLYHWRKVPGSTATAQSAKPWASDAGRRALASAIERRGLAGRVEPGRGAGHYRVIYTHAPVLTSVLMPTYGAGTIPPAHVARVCNAIASIARTTPPGSIEFVLATDDGTVPAQVRAAAGAVPLQVVAVPGPFNFSARINAAAHMAAGAMLLLANDDLEAVEAGWLEALLNYAQLPQMGAVGPRLDLPDGRVQHAGLLIGVRGVAAHAFHHASPDHWGYFGSLIGPRNMSAVSGACLLTPAMVFHEIGGLDETLPVDFNDVDYCLRVNRAGLRVVFTPFARLQHHESASIGGRTPGADALRLMEMRWRDVIANDPYYNPNLSRDAVDYRLADPPRR